MSLSLAVLTTGILLLGNWLGLLPDSSTAMLENRQRFSEALAVQLSAAAARRELDLIRVTLRAVTDGDPDVLSVGLRGTNGELVAASDAHRQFWNPSSRSRSTATHVQVPVLQGARRWGTVEVRFASPWPGKLGDWLYSPPVGLVGFVGSVGFLSYLVFLRRTLVELNPSAVIPERVRAAFDVLPEGALILDERERILLANAAFARTLGVQPASLVGGRISDVGWRWGESGETRQEYPWTRALREAQPQTGISLRLQRGVAQTSTFIVNSAPILSPKGQVRGVMTTFDDITSLERKHTELQRSLQQWKYRHEAIGRMNKKLQILASRDGLTGCLNRRALEERFDSLFSTAKRQGVELSCIMFDIDHFKSVNDRYGHDTGDRVLQRAAWTLQSGVRDNDLVGRYGGEEFCLVLPGLGLDQAAEVAERLRRGIQSDSADSPVAVTASLGVASLASGAQGPSELVKQADQALYTAKEGGRNRVVCWSGQPPGARPERRFFPQRRRGAEKG